MGGSKEMFEQMREGEMASLNLFLQSVDETFVLPIENKTMLTADKSELSEIASKIVEAVDDGNADALDTLILAKKGKYIFESICDMMKGKASIPEGKDYSKHNANIRLGQTGVKYYFDGCNDPIWNELNMEMVQLKEKIAARETWLKSFTKPTEVEAEANEYGEEIAPARTVYPPAKMGGESLIFTLK